MQYINIRTTPANLITAVYNTYNSAITSQRMYMCTECTGLMVYRDMGPT